MARTSGVVDAASAPLSQPAQFTDGVTGSNFRIAHRAAGTFVHFSQGEAEGERRLDYFIGAGAVGRSYASEVDGYLFQAPVSYYSATRQWGLSPGFEGSDRLNLTRPVEPACLTCHASGLRTTAGTLNGYRNPAFAEPGVSCERCHGTGETHVARMRSGDLRQGTGIVNPDKLPAPARDSVCAQCHLVSVMRIAKAGNTSKYEPGNLLFDSTAAFLWSNGAQRSGANSHFEQLVRSACWNGSAGKLWCGTCHTTHTTGAANAGTKPYRQRCLTCHSSVSGTPSGVGAADCSASPASRQAVKDDCVSCHMPSKPIGTVPHAAQVDHTISRIPAKASASVVSDDASLIPFPGSSAGDRELGLAYASEALPQNNRVWGMRALELLKKANPDDAMVAVQLAQLYDRMGQEQEACGLFAQAVKQGVPSPGALVNLGACQAKQGDLDSAILSWTQALQRNPALEPARLNLAVAQIRSGRIESARTNLQTALKYDPFSPHLRELLRSITPK
jgi:hypothetical protein